MSPRTRVRPVCSASGDRVTYYSPKVAREIEMEREKNVFWGDFLGACHLSPGSKSGVKLVERKELRGDILGDRLVNSLSPWG